MAPQDGRLLKSKQTLARDELATMLETLAARIREGRIRFEQGTAEVELDLPTHIRTDLEIEDSARRTGGFKRELEIEISWMVDDQGMPVETGSGGGISIS